VQAVPATSTTVMTFSWVKTDDRIRLAIVPCPRGGHWLTYEVSQMKLAGVDVLVSMLPPEEAAELGSFN